VSGLCRDCKHFELFNAGERSFPKPFGGCGRWYVGYGNYDLKLNECQVEGDEGWGMIVGPEFGCVLFEPVEDRE
jgi:hypothetical protein